MKKSTPLKGASVVFFGFLSSSQVHTVTFSNSFNGSSQISL